MIHVYIEKQKKDIIEKIKEFITTTFIIFSLFSFIYLACFLVTFPWI